MTAGARIQNVEVFIESQKYLKGRQYRVLYDHGKDVLAVEFKTLSEDQYEGLAVALKTNMMRHIEIRVMQFVAAEKQRSKHLKHNNGKTT